MIGFWGCRACLFNADSLIFSLVSSATTPFLPLFHGTFPIFETLIFLATSIFFEGLSSFICLLLSGFGIPLFQTFLPFKDFFIFSIVSVDNFVPFFGLVLPYIPFFSPLFAIEIFSLPSSDSDPHSPPEVEL